uniref:Ribosomal protein S11 n=1 Tax=Schimmelmannia schousboei TaxID=173468 RepID=A0A0E3DBL3_9FLOR|nr:ribosomal protein S11 [Schimmelmannia schousboei]
MFIKNKKSIILTILFTSNNIFYTLTKLNGEVLFWTSVGSKKLKGTKKITVTTITLAMNSILNFVNEFKCNNIHIKFKGFNKNKRLAMKYLKQTSLNILSISDLTAMAHNGCRLSKMRRI